MNYGIGGFISLHTDANYNLNEESQIKVGGPRLITFMTFLSSVEFGGRTLFPQLGLSVKPIKGSALYWFNVGPHMNYDSRVIHMGCPVIYGDKWIANKWIRFNGQFKSYISSTKEHYSIL